MFTPVHLTLAGIMLFTPFLVCPACVFTVLSSTATAALPVKRTFCIYFTVSFGRALELILHLWQKEEDKDIQKKLRLENASIEVQVNSSMSLNTLRSPHPHILQPDLLEL